MKKKINKKPAHKSIDDLEELLALVYVSSKAKQRTSKYKKLKKVIK